MRHSIGIPRVVRRLSDLSIVHLLILGFALAGTTIIATVVTRLLVPAAPSPLHQWVLLKNLLLPLLLLAVYSRTVRSLEHRRASELASKPGITLFAVGVGVGTAIISIYVVVLIATGAAQVRAGIAAGGLLSLANELLVPWLTAVGEELLFRAVLFRVTEDVLGTSAAVLISATLFGLSHAVNPGATPAALIALALGMGSLLALAFAATRNLWFPIGLHMGWNTAEGFLYGLPNSGMADPLQLARTSITRASALSGGSFGPEDSIIVVVICMVMSALLVYITIRKQRWNARRFQLSRSRQTP